MLALVCLAAAWPGGEVRAGVFDPQTFTLENGMQVVVIPNHRAPVVSHMVWYRAGAADEPPGKSGVAHFLEHLMFKGTEAVPDGEFAKTVARNGGQSNAFTSWDYTGYYQNVATERLELVMRLEADRMINLRLTEADALTERDVILEERRSRTDNNPGALLREQITATLYMNHPYGVPIIGWAHEAGALTRADALDWYRRYYAPNNAILVVAGDVTVEQIRPLAEAHYGVIPRRPVPPRARPVEPTHHAPRQVNLESPRVRQPSWTRNYLAPSYTRGASEHAYPLEVLTEILGGGTTSRLYRALVVDQGLAASAGVSYGPGSVDLSALAVYLSPRPVGRRAEPGQAGGGVRGGAGRVVAERGYRGRGGTRQVAHAGECDLRPRQPADRCPGAGPRADHRPHRRGRGSLARAHRRGHRGAGERSGARGVRVEALGHRAPASEAVR